MHTPLVRAAIENQSAAIAALIAQGAAVDAHDRLGLSPLIAAAFFGAADAVDSLLTQSANLGTKVKAAVQPGEAASEVYAELPPEGSTAPAAAPLHRAVRAGARFRLRIISALTRG